MENPQKSFSDFKNKGVTHHRLFVEKRSSLASHERGFALLLSLILLPLLISLFIAICGTFWFIQKKNELLFLCERSLLQTQQILLEGESQLLMLNSQIRALVTRKTFLKRSLLFAKTPVDRAIIHAELLHIELQLSRLKTQQLFLKTGAETKAALKMHTTERLHKNTLRNLSSIWDTSLHFKVVSTSPRIQLEVEKIDPSASLYKIPIDLTLRQTLTRRWHVVARSLFPPWMRFLKSTSFSWQDSCSVAPEQKERHRWLAEIKTETF